MRNRSSSRRFAVALVGAAVGLMTFSLAFQVAKAATQVDVVLTQPWTDTGRFVNAGERLIIHARGTMNWYTGGCPTDGACDVSPDGVPWKFCESFTPAYADPGLRCFSLVGKLGADGQPFQVGSAADVTALSSGELYLGVNDNYYPDNSGSWVAEITRFGEAPASEGSPRQPGADQPSEAAICGSRSIRLAMQSLETRQMSDPNGAMLSALATIMTGGDVGSSSATIIDSKTGSDGGRYTSSVPGSFVCRGLFVHGDVRAETGEDADAAAQLSAATIQSIVQAQPTFIEWYLVKPTAERRYNLKLLPTSIQLAREYSTEFEYPNP